MQWSDLSRKEKAELYETIINKLLAFRDERWNKAQKDGVHLDFMSHISLEKIMDILERRIYKKMYTLFAEEWSLLDYRPAAKKPTLAETALLEWDALLSSAEKTALRNLSASFVAPYRILRFFDGRGRLENVILPKSNIDFITTFQELAPGDVIVTRLLPLGKEYMLKEPWLLLLPKDQKRLAETFHDAMREAGYKKRDVHEFCKNQAPVLMGIINETVVEMEKEIAAILEKVPFRPDWHEAEVDDPQRIITFLEENGAFSSIEGEKKGRFLFINRQQKTKLTWGYIVVDENRLAICVPPKEDPDVVLSALYEAMKDEKEDLKFTKIGCSNEKTAYYNQQVLDDLAVFITQNEEMVQDILMPRKEEGSPIEQARADFFAQLSLWLGSRLKN